MLVGVVPVLEVLLLLLIGVPYDFRDESTRGVVWFVVSGVSGVGGRPDNEEIFGEDGGVALIGGGAAFLSGREDDDDDKDGSDNVSFAAEREGCTSEGGGFEDKAFGVGGCDERSAAGGGANICCVDGPSSSEGVGCKSEGGDFEDEAFGVGGWEGGLGAEGGAKVWCTDNDLTPYIGNEFVATFVEVGGP